MGEMDSAVHVCACFAYVCECSHVYTCQDAAGVIPMKFSLRTCFFVVFFGVSMFLKSKLKLGRLDSKVYF